MSELVPRLYQDEIFMQARDGNIITAMDTGSGKTFIAVLLIKWITAQPTLHRKIVVFLVPKVPLVDQQTSFITSQTPLTVKGFYGAMGVDLWDRAQWLKHLNETNVVVATAQVFKDVLAHSHWSMDKVSLIVFDEAHHCAKNHVYNQIMRDHYFHTPPDQRPKIFGMTASPIWNLKNPVQALADLERNMSSKVVGVRQHVDELTRHVPRPTEVVYEYPPPPASYPDYPSPTMWEKLCALNLRHFRSDQPKELDELSIRYAVAFENLGPYGAELFLFNYLSHRLTELKYDSHNAYLASLDHISNSRADRDSTSKDTGNTEKGHVIQDITAILDSDRQLFESSVGQQIQDGWLSPKVRSLVSMLAAKRSELFHGIIFVEQRHIASTLSSLLSRMPQLLHWLKSAPLVGHGHHVTAKRTTVEAKGMSHKGQHETVKAFREMKINLLVATSVAEEGLDFQACHLIVRFDGLKTMVGYVQSRGRARHHTSVYVLMWQRGDLVERARYDNLKLSEPGLKQVYQRVDQEDNEAMDDIEEDPRDLANRSRYIVETTGATLTYDYAIGLLNNICSLVRVDKFTRTLQPKYIITGGYSARIELPSALPIPRHNLVYEGPLCRSKKEARRAAAFKAVCALHQLGVLDDFLLPIRAEKGDEAEDADGNKTVPVADVPEMMKVFVRDPFGNPWEEENELWLHPLEIDGVTNFGLIAARKLPQTESTLVETGRSAKIRLCEGSPLTFESEELRNTRLILLQEFNALGIWHAITGRPPRQLACFLVPCALSSEFSPLWQLMESIVTIPETQDWESLVDEDMGRTIVMFRARNSRPYLLTSTTEGTLSQLLYENERGEVQYPESLLKLYRGSPNLPPDEPLLQVRPYHRNMMNLYRGVRQEITPPGKKILLPRASLRRSTLPYEIVQTFRLLPPLTRHITDICRVRAAIQELSLPPIKEELYLEALTLPCANAGFSNQRLETLGDSVLKLSTCVYIFNNFPHRHEGQLDLLRCNSVSNRYLLGRAKEIGLERFLTPEVGSVRSFQPVCENPSKEIEGQPFVLRTMPRRSLQDCMEASLGASFLTGGISMALRTGTALHLCFGGPEAWTTRYARPKAITGTTPVYFAKMENALGYRFSDIRILQEALTHPSFAAGDTPSYQRLEFLGDALVDLVVIHDLYSRNPSAPPGQLSWARSRVVCAPALASVAVKRLEAHLSLFYNSSILRHAIEKAVPMLQSMSYEEVVRTSWKMDPPKVLCDLLESCLGAVLVDSGYDLELAMGVTKQVIQGLLDTLVLPLPRDPTSMLMIWIAKQGCDKVCYRKCQSNPDIPVNDSVVVVVHDIDIGAPVQASSITLAKGLASEQAKALLEDDQSTYALKRICDCPRNTRAQKYALEVARKTEDLDEETQEGFALSARLQLRDEEGEPQNEEDAGSDEGDSDVVESLVGEGSNGMEVDSPLYGDPSDESGDVVEGAELA